MKCLPIEKFGGVFFDVKATSKKSNRILSLYHCFFPIFESNSFMMIHFLRNRFFILTFSIACGWMPLAVSGQIFVTPVQNNAVSESPGFYYALPQNVIKLDFVIEKTEKLKGPYSEFAESTIGVQDFITKDETHFRVMDIIMNIEAEPDPEAWFFVEFDERGSKDARSLIFDLKENGIILSADEAPLSKNIARDITETTLVNAGNEKRFHYFAERNLYQRVDTIIRKITIDTTVIRRNILQTAWVDRNPAQKARAAADMIHKIRDSRFNLISGFQEINYGSSIVYMDNQLQQLEEEYLALFLGKEIKQLYTQSVYFVPKHDQKGTLVVAGFSETLGLTESTAKANQVELNIDLNGQETLTKSGSAKGKLTNSLYYRIPQSALLTLTYQGKVFYKQRKPISQLGTIAVAPVNKTRLQFSPESGMVTTIKRE